ncbi:MAG TPA: cytochrome c family protein [Alphaproteobacteria bacterium]|nr:cytochrome c family protein [Alphaproteobacteria bacterium]
MDSFEWNKIFGAVLAAALLVVGLNILVDELMHPHKPEKLAIKVEGVEAGAGPSAGATEDAAPPDWGSLLPAADLAAGDKVHKQCLQCHSFDKGGKNGVGPNLWNVVNAPHAFHPEFNYSAAIKGKPGPWSYDELYAFLKKPSAYAPGTKMAFAGLRKREDRVNLIAWLRAQADTPAEIPAPNPAAAAPAAPAEGAAPAAPATPADGSAPAAPDAAPAPAPAAAPAEGAAPAPAAPAAPAGEPAPTPAPAPAPVPAP